MSYVKIKIQKPATREDILRWEDHMQEKAKCWNKFCLGIYTENEIKAVHVVKEGNDDNTFLTTLCEDCIKDSADYNVLVNDSHLMVESVKKTY